MIAFSNIIMLSCSSVKLRMKTDKKQFDIHETEDTQDDGMTNGEINDKGLDEEVELIPEQQVNININ